MRFANLDNVNFEEADFRNSDLTGVRIEETSPVLAIATRHFGNRIFAAYKDNTIREWKNINKPGMAVSEIVVENTKGNVIFLGFLHGSNLYAMTNEELIFYDFDDKEKLIQRARFRLKPNYRKVVVKNDLLFHLSENKENTNNVSLIDLKKFEEQVYLIIREKVILFDCLDSQAIALTDGKSGIGINGIGNTEIPGNINLPVHEPTSLAAQTSKTDQEYLLACGQKNGEVLIWKIKHLNDQWMSDLLLKKQVHDGIVSSLFFLDDSTIVSGSVDRKISILRFDRNSDRAWETLHQDDLCLTIRCKGIKIDGLKGTKEYDMFKQFIKDHSI